MRAFFAYRLMSKVHRMFHDWSNHEEVLAQSFDAIILASGDVHAAHARRMRLASAVFWRLVLSGGLKIGVKTYPRSLALADHEIVLNL
jgi:hypothetical protein